MKRNRTTRTRRHPSVKTESVEVRQLLSAVSVESASIDGTGNNVDNDEWGSTDVELLRLSEAEYSDGVSAPSGDDRPSAREISNALAAQSTSVVNDRGLTDYLWIWGQFLDHDIDLSEGAEPAEEFNIEVPAGDVFFDPFGTGEVELGLTRTVYVEGDESSDGARQQLNQITAFIDGSVVYGSDQERADALRTFEGGQLKTSDGNLLPFNEDGLHNAGGSSDTLFVAGDVRANENAVLTSMHTLFVREHNGIAAELAASDPELSDEQLYQQARAIVTAELQVITYSEFLPALLGPDAISEYVGYDPTVNPNIANEFSTAAYRFGHSLLSSELQRLDSDGNVIEAGNLSLQEAFFNPDVVVSEGIDSLLRGAATQASQEIDTLVIDDVRNFLFGPPGAGGLDLVSLNIQRGRDHGLADYNQVRRDLGLAPVTSFDEITSNPDLAQALEETYGSVDNIDLWVGGLAEDHLDGSSMGETFTTIIADQFERLRDGDRYWYQNVFSGKQLETIEQTRLSDIIERNTDIEGLQTNVFFLEGAEILHVDTSTEGTDNVLVRERNGEIQIIDATTRRVVDSRPEGEVAAIAIRGSDGVRERFTLSGSLRSMEIQVDGGKGRGDVVIVEGTRHDDVIVVDGNVVSMTDLDVVFQGVDMLILDGGPGSDVLDATEAAVSQVVLNGGAGDDVVLGGIDAETVKRRDRFSDRQAGRGQTDRTPANSGRPAGDLVNSGSERRSGRKRHRADAVAPTVNVSNEPTEQVAVQEAALLNVQSPLGERDSRRRNAPGVPSASRRGNR